MFSCNLCEKETCYLYRYCDKCQAVKRIMNVYGSDEVLAILNRVCLRNCEQVGYKISAELKEEIKAKKVLKKHIDTGDESYIKPKTRQSKASAD